MRFPHRSASSKVRWTSMACIAALFATPLALARTVYPSTVLDAGMEILVPLTIVLFALRVPRTVLKRLGAVRRERSFFRSIASRSRQASMVCEPVRSPSGGITDFRILYMNGGGSGLMAHNTAHRKKLIDLLSRNDFSRTVEAWIRILRTEQPEITKLPIRNAAGEKATWDVYVVPQSGCLVVTALHSREEQAAQRQVEELHDFNRAVFDSAPVSIIATDIGGTIIAMNESAERLTRFKKQELVGKHSFLQLHCPEEFLERSTAVRRRGGRPFGEIELLLEHKRLHEKDDWTYKRRDGSRVCVDLTVTPLHIDGGLSGYLAVAFDVTERKQLADTAFYMAHHDQLTGLPNRTLVRSTIEAALRNAEKSSGTVAIFAIDIDYFKRINDSLGHAAGDTVLTTVAARVSASIRQADFAARLGGDEFVIVFPDMRRAADAEHRARAILEVISRPFLVGQREVCVTASIGYCLFPECAGSAEDLLRHADLAMYSAKAAGRGSFAPYTPELQRATQGRLEIEEDLRHALRRGEFTLHYQPQVACISGNVDSLEMLLRWNSPKHGNVSPDVFVPIAEEAGLIAAIGAWSIQQACRDGAAMQSLLQRRIRIAVNLSPHQIQQPALFVTVQQALRDSGLPPGDLEFEITEQVLMSGTPSVLHMLDRIRGLGISLAIDDFGTGFSSFSYILQYQVDRLKIDRSFVSQVASGGHAASIVRTVIAMAHNLGLKVCAEGAETEPQIEFLMRRRCDEIQGYFFARPVPFERVLETIRAIEQPARKRSRASLAAKRHVTLPFPAPAPQSADTRARLPA